MADADDRQTIVRLCDDTLPALIGRLDASSLGELEVRKGTWRVRLRRKAIVSGHATGSGGRAVKWGRRATDVAPAGKRDGPREGGREAREAREAHEGAGREPGRSHAAETGGGRAEVRVRTSGNGSGPLTPVGPGRDRPGPRTELGRRTATSPAVGYYMPTDGVTPGRRIRSGDVIGHVDVLGVRVEVESPADGVVGRVLAQPGEAVEYGQELLRIDLAVPSDESIDSTDTLDALTPSEG